MSNCAIETYRKIWLCNGGGYLILRPWTEDNTSLELCTEPGQYSEEWFGKIQIILPKKEDVEILIKALTLAMSEMN